jgi:predicted transcriptional regulator of viral defense system/very-short-patch-repair endonuclease
MKGRSGALSEVVPILEGMTAEIPPRLREWARDQAGVVSRQQAIESGMTVGALHARVKFGRWSQVHRGVYATFTGPVGRDAELWAASLYVGVGALLSHQTAAEILRLTDRRSSHIHVTIPANRRVIPPIGVIIHISSSAVQGWRFARGIPPHTFAEQTILDLVDAATDLDEVVAWVTAGFRRNATSEARMRAAIAARKKLRWRDRLDEIISMAAGGTHSPLEYRHDRDVQRAHGLPEPVRQAKFRKPDGTWGYRDRYYPQYDGLVIELDGKGFHPDEQRGQDQERDNQAAVTGSTLRYGWDAVTRRPCETAQQEADALRHRGWTGTLRPCSPTCRAAADSRSAHSAHSAHSVPSAH